MAFVSFLSPKPTPSPKLYFYVPKKLQRLILYLPLGDFGNAFHFAVYDSSDERVSISYRDNRKTLIIPVKPGQDGKIWSLERAVSPSQPLVMLTSPQAFSLERAAVMTPSDALR